MDEQPYLIAHKVRGQPAFDIAIQMECPICSGVGEAGRRPEDAYEGPSCEACAAEGHWWIVATSGHRAYPYWSRKIADDFIKAMIDEFPDDHPDHYQCDIDAETLRSITVADITKAQSLLQSLGLIKPREPIRRRV